MQRFIDQARKEYIGTPDAVATVVDDCGETIVLVRSLLQDGSFMYLGWIGGSYADSPDEFGGELPYTGVRWKKITNK